MPFNDYIYDKCITESNTLQQLKTTGRVILPPSGSPPKWKTGIRNAIFTPGEDDIAVFDGLRLNVNIDTPQYEPPPEYYHSLPRVIHIRKPYENRKDKWMNMFKKCKSENREYDDKYPHKEDYKLVASSAIRAGNSQSLIKAEYKIALLLDNKRDFTNSIREYKKIIKIAKQINDKESEAIGYNCIGCAYHFMGRYVRAIEYHEKHLSVTCKSGQVIALCNIGLAYRDMNDIDNAIVKHRQAYNIAREINSPGLNSLASGSLGYSLCKSEKEEELIEAKECIDNYMHFCSDSLATNGALNDPVARDPRNISESFTHLGGIMSKIGTHEDAISYFNRAKVLAWNSGDQELSNRNSCNIGIHEADMVIESYIDNINRCEPDGKYNTVNRIEELFKIVSTLQQLPPSPLPLVLKQKEKPLELPEI